jgi:hypothetical protein
MVFFIVPFALHTAVVSEFYNGYGEFRILPAPPGSLVLLSPDQRVTWFALVLRDRIQSRRHDFIPQLALTWASKFIKSMIRMLSSDFTACWISRLNPSSIRFAVSLSNFSTDSSQMNGREARPG